MDDGQSAVQSVVLMVRRTFPLLNAWCVATSLHASVGVGPRGRTIMVGIFARTPRMFICAKIQKQIPEMRLTFMCQNLSLLRSVL